MSNILELLLEKNKVYKLQTGGKVIKFYNEYLSSPKYRSRLEHMGYSKPDEVIEKRINDINSVKVFTQNESPNLFEQLQNEITKTPYSTNGSIFKVPNIILDNAQIKKLKINKNSVLAHEYGHAELNSIPLNHKESTIINSRLNNNANAHDTKPYEAKADINALRFEMKTQGLYDAGKTDIDKTTLDKAPKSIIKDRLLKNFKAEDLMWLMNNIASNKFKTNKFNT